jgi:hypothetical protein
VSGVVFLTHGQKGLSRSAKSAAAVGAAHPRAAVAHKADATHEFLNLTGLALGAGHGFLITGKDQFFEAVLALAALIFINRHCSVLVIGWDFICYAPAVDWKII